MDSGVLQSQSSLHANWIIMSNSLTTKLFWSFYYVVVTIWLVVSKLLKFQRRYFLPWVILISWCNIQINNLFLGKFYHSRMSSISDSNAHASLTSISFPVTASAHTLILQRTPSLGLHLSQLWNTCDRVCHQVTREVFCIVTVASLVTLQPMVLLATV